MSPETHPFGPEEMAVFRERTQRYLRDNADALRPVDTEVASVIITRAMQDLIHGTAHEIDTITLAADGREIDISSLTDLIRVERCREPPGRLRRLHVDRWVGCDHVRVNEEAQELTHGR